MPIKPFLGQKVFDPDAIDLMGRALADACLALGLKDKEDAAVGILAARIIDQAGDGVRDLELLKAAALKGFLH